MKFKDPITGEYKTLYLKTGDTLPVGTIVSFEGDEIPEGYEEVIGEEARVVISPTEPTTGEEVWIQKGKNLFNKETIVSDKYVSASTGELGNLSSGFASDFIKIEPNVLYYWNDTIDRGNEGAFYDENGVYLSGISSRLFTTPNNAKYVRLTGLLENLDTMQLEQGDTTTSYEPYIEKKIYTKNDNGVYEEFYDETNLEQVNFSDYIALDSGYTLNSGIAYKIGNTVYLYYDISGTINAGQTVIGDILKPLLITCYGSGRTIVKAGDSAITNVKPNANMAISQGDFRIHSETAGTIASGNVILILAE